ncbi:glycosyl hydrolase 115 family protein [Dyadobacter sp. CY345]|uniref:glycosyl hydrolase 115 family protein n=1 Tax=Dyadobacter sp. CY345 TaxID=2909335 RepID=UPI001F2A9E41|nr:glycosyl hydrolase 115 family protein [Dyadobacter sp. CY345]MCF2447624.1 glycosyl hydrolase 115 family protein [Dyadobacter sp. CY345]
MKQRQFKFIRIDILIIFCLPVLANAQQFELVTAQNNVTIYYQQGEFKLDSIAAHLLASDIELVSGYHPKVSTDISNAKGNIIIIGKYDSQLVKNFGNNASDSAIVGKWECYSLRFLSKPSANIANALVIAGSDARGTAYGVFSVSGKIGVTPWYWWADATPKTQKSLALDRQDFTSKTPSVRFRGIFINDEDWGLQPWAAKTFEPDTKDIGPKTYAKVFELLLRLKANLIWPAMHPSTKAFYHYPGNIKAAEDYQIVVGSSHAEPMLRNNVSEWNQKEMGHFNYLTNKKKVDEYWESRIKESSKINGIYTTGMRGIHDGAMEGVKTMAETVPLMDTIIRVQRDMLKKYVNAEITKVPQVFTPYKEVLEIYDAGLRVPEDITLVWPDDNYGYIQRLSNAEENRRPGGSGVYYHASYWGRPHDYLWLNTTHPAHLREEMTKAFTLNARQLWVLNVGDIKPAEYATQLFMDMAYDIEPFEKPAFSKAHLQKWLSTIFGDKQSVSVAQSLWKYYDLAFERKPEYMGWSRTEPTTGIDFTQYNHTYYNDQAQLRIDAYDRLLAQVKNIGTNIQAKDKDAFYELVEYPVKGAALINKKFLFRDKAYIYGKQGRLSSAHYASLSGGTQEEIASETLYYNRKLANGKWKGMMDMFPRKLPVFNLPVFDLPVKKNLPAFCALPEGYSHVDSTSAHDLKLLEFNKWNKQRYFIDVFLTQPLKKAFTVKASEKWIVISSSHGELTPDGLNSQQRIWVEIDWNKAPVQKSLKGNIIVESGDDQYIFDVIANNANVKELENFKGHVETAHYLSIDAADYSAVRNMNSRHWNVIEGLGSNGKSLEALPLVEKAAEGDLDTLKVKSNPAVEYNFYVFGHSPADITISSLPTYPLNKNFELRYGVSIDGGPITIFNFRTFGRSDEWKKNVLSNSAKRTFKVPNLKPGKHKLEIYMIDPGVILTHIFIDLSVAQPFYGSLSLNPINTDMKPASVSKSVK